MFMVVLIWKLEVMLKKKISKEVSINGMYLVRFMIYFFLGKEILFNMFCKEFVKCIFLFLLGIDCFSLF